jgi:hypothetical protein
MKWIYLLPLSVMLIMTGCQFNAGSTIKSTPIPTPISTPIPILPSESPTLLKLSPYQALSKIRDIERFTGGTYQGIMTNSYSFATPLERKNVNGEIIKEVRFYDFSNGNVYRVTDSGIVQYYNILDSTSYPKVLTATNGMKMGQEQLEKINQLEQQLYDQVNVYNVVWSPNYNYIAYYIGNVDTGQAYVWKAGNTSSVPIIGANIDRYFFVWAQNEDYVLVDRGTSVDRRGQIYSISRKQLSEGFSYHNTVYFSPDLKWIIYSVTSGIRSKEKEIYESDQTLSLSLMDLSAFKKKVLLQADDHTDYNPVKWKSETELLYKKHDYQKKSDKVISLTIPNR